ncbi:nucleotidyltransferase family protein [Niabella beijingensis]|uniref:nucleotidyltransferase family protein n=1 Tax=Niabella beijingensis TaxID=2872700 RepID=UPI001CC0565F|nr:NDP-sugar synthase [Niabella beijingensis]MBZ4187684.1 NDP-sugar synthase [Niabella beijingensis]
MFEFATILAAGKGERLLGSTENLPKALIEVGGKPLIWDGLSQLIDKVSNIVVTVGRNSSSLVNFVFSSGVKTVLNTTNQGNAWWIFNTFFKVVNSPVLVIPCDNIAFLDLDFIYSSYRILHSPPCMIVPVVANPEIEGDYIHRKGGVVKQISRGEKAEIYSSGMQVINPRLIVEAVNDSAMEDFINVWSFLLEKRLLKCSELYPHQWYSVNTPTQLVNADLMLRTQ